MPKPPELLDTKILAKTRIFTIEGMRVKFSNEKICDFERVSTGSSNAVMIIPMLDDETFLLIREYAAAANAYFLGFPKGAVSKGEDVLETANRELMEEVGYGAKQLIPLARWSFSPAYFNAMMDVILAKDLYPQRMEGDEPEPIEVIPWKLRDIDVLLGHPEFHESRSVGALLLLDRMSRK